MNSTPNNRCFLIDSENIGDAWVNLLDHLSDNDNIIVFYTDKSHHLSCENIRKLMEKGVGSVSWISCYNDSANALDFQLVSELGSMMCCNSADEYVIVSNDKGYDAVVKYWNRNGGNVRRIKESECAKQKIKKTTTTPTVLSLSSESEASTESAEAPAEKESSVASELRKTAPASEPSTDTKKPQIQQPDTRLISAKSIPEKLTPIKVKTSQQTISEPLLSPNITSVLSLLCKSIPIEKNPLLNNALIAFFTTSLGSKTYNKLKEYPDYCAALTQRLLPNKNERIENYIVLMLKFNKISTAYAPEIYRIYNKRKKISGNIVRNDFLKEFGNEKGSKLYSLFKKHYPVINKI